MKNVLKVLGNLNRDRRSKVPLLIVAIVAVIGFSMAACGDDDSGGGGKNALDGTSWKRSGYPISITFKSPNYTVTVPDHPEMGSTGTYSISSNLESFKDNTLSGYRVTITHVSGYEMFGDALLSGNTLYFGNFDIPFTKQ